MPIPQTYQIESVANGALAMACQKAQAYVDAGRAETTRRVYVSAWRRWAQWCAAMHTTPLPAAPEAVAAYLAALADAGKSVATIKGARAAIQYFHAEAGQRLDPGNRAIAAVMGGIVRRVSRPIRRAAALELGQMQAIVTHIEGNSVRALRDRALLLVGFFAALRRSELVALNVAGGSGVGPDSGRSFVEIRPEGLRLHISGSKTSAATQTIVIGRRDDALCATQALECYLAATSLTHGPLLRAVSKADRLLTNRLDATGVRHILQQRAGHAGVSPHGLRAGFITSAAKVGMSEHVIQRISRHKSVDVLRGYIHAADGYAVLSASCR